MNYHASSQSSANLARTTRSCTAQRVALSDPSLRVELVSNPNLHPEVLKDLWRTGKKLLAYKYASQVISNPLSPQQLEIICSMEERSMVFQAILKSNAPTPSLLERIVESGAISAAVGESLLENWWWLTPSEISDKMFEVAGGKVPLLASQVPSSTITDDMVRLKLMSFKEWGSVFSAPAASALLTHRPGLLDLYLDESMLHTSAAGSLVLQGNLEAQRKLLDIETLDENKSNARWLEDNAYTYLALFANPVVDLELVLSAKDIWMKSQVPYDHRWAIDNRQKYTPYTLGDPQLIEDPDHLRKLVKRAMPGGSKPRGRVWDLPALARNPHLTLELAEEIVNSVSYKVYPDAWPYSDPGRDVDVTLELLVERFPSLEASHEEDLARVRNKSVPVYEEYVVEPSTTAPDSSLYYMSDSTVAYIDEYLKEDENAWRTLFSLVDSFTGKVGELVMVATSING